MAIAVVVLILLALGAWWLIGSGRDRRESRKFDQEMAELNQRSDQVDREIGRRDRTYASRGYTRVRNPGRR